RRVTGGWKAPANAGEIRDGAEIIDVERVVCGRGPGGEHQAPVGNRHVPERIEAEARRTPIRRLNPGRLGALGNGLRRQGSDENAACDRSDRQCAPHEPPPDLTWICAFALTMTLSVVRMAPR